MLRWGVLYVLILFVSTCTGLLLTSCRGSGGSVYRLSMSTKGAPSLTADVHVEVVSDFACPWCYVGKARLKAAIEAYERSAKPEDKSRSGAKVHVSFHPYMIDTRTHPDGEDYLAYNKRRWGGDGWTASMKRSARKDGCEFANWTTWPNSLRAHCLQKFVEDTGKGDEINSLVFQTIYERGGNASDLETLVSLAEEVGLSPAEARAYLSSQKGEDQVRREDHGAKTELDVGGVPYFIVRGAAKAGSAAAGSSDGGNSGYSEVTLNGAVGPDQLLRAFTAVSRG